MSKEEKEYILLKKWMELYLMISIVVVILIVFIIVGKRI